jgi:PAS domain S-box-containing protein
MSSEEQFRPDLPETVLLDRAGFIVAANQAWLEFARLNGGDPARTGVGTSYLAVCDAANHDPAAREVGAAVRAAVRGDLPAPIRLRIPCHAPDVERWYDVFVSSRHDDWGDCIGATVALARAGPPRSEAPASCPRSVVAAPTDSAAGPYQVAFDHAPIGMAVLQIDANGSRTVKLANQALANLFGTSLEHLIGTDLDEFSTRDNLDHDRRIVAALLSGSLRTYSRHKCYRRSDGRRVWTEVRVSRVDVPGIDGATTLSQFVDVTERHEAQQRRARRAELDSAVAEVATSVLAGMPLPAVYRLIAEVTARVFEAENVAFGLPDTRTRQLAPVAVLGPAGADLLHLEVPGPVAAARFGPPDPDGGLVAVARREGDEPFGETDLGLLVALAGQVALAVELGRARADQQRLAVLEDRQRIAQDLHDTVIQDLIAIGMQLDARAAAQAEHDPEQAGREARLVDQLEEAVRRLRGSVFDLREPELRLPLPQAVAAVCADASRVLGHRPSLRTCGDLAAVPDRVADAVGAVLREAISNVARHARAASTDVILTVDADLLRLEVRDDGRGLPAILVPGDGIANVRRRALTLRGEASVSTRPEGGTCLTWSCPF